MSSTGTSQPSSGAEPEPSRIETTYHGPDYRAAVSGAWGPPDPLLHPDPFHPPRFYRWVAAILRWLLPKLFRIRVEGIENLPTKGAYIIASNHQAWYDPAFLVTALPSPVPMVYSMARRDTVFNRAWKRAIVRRAGVFAIAPHEGDLDLTGLASVYHVLSRGGRVLIFPEGRYSRGRRLRPLKKGVAHFALQAGVPIVPVAIDGDTHLWPGAQIRISIGKPVYPNPPTWWDPSRRVLTIVENVQRAILGAFNRAPTPPEERLLGRLRSRLGGLLRRAGAGRPRTTEPPGR